MDEIEPTVIDHIAV